MPSEKVTHLVVINALHVALCFSAATLDPQKTVENCRVKHKNRRALLKTSLAGTNAGSVSQLGGGDTVYVGGAIPGVGAQFIGGNNYEGLQVSAGLPLGAGIFAGSNNATGQWYIGRNKPFPPNNDYIDPSTIMNSDINYVGPSAQPGAWRNSYFQQLERSQKPLWWNGAGVSPVTGGSTH
jgi:hypothetical protein